MKTYYSDLLKKRVTVPENEIYKGFTESELKEAFDSVSNPKDWRAAINAIILRERLEVVVAAIEFYTAAPIEVKKINKTHVQVISVGYRLGPAGP